MNTRLILLPILCLLLTGCQSRTRSISNSSYGSGYYESHYHPWDQYRLRRELNETDVLGINTKTAASEQDIASALDQSRDLGLRKGGSILLVQSGAEYPDASMVTALEKDFTITPFTGLVSVSTNRFKEVVANSGPDYSRVLRLAAARSGSENIVCYWGILESANENLATKTVSWIPVVNWVIPDERQHMRIRLKIAVMNVRTGTWRMLTPETFEDKRIATHKKREATDQKLVESLKDKAYTAGAKEVLTLANNR